MLPADLKKIEDFAYAQFVGLSESSTIPLREEALSVYRFFLGTLPKDKWNIHMKFMSEVDNRSPDLALRSQYRKQLIDLIHFN